MVQEYFSGMVYYFDDYKDVLFCMGGVERLFMYKEYFIVGMLKNGQEGEEGGLNCYYLYMKNWQLCYGLENRICWLEVMDGSGKRIDIDMDYENVFFVLFGKMRYVSVKFLICIGKVLIDGDYSIILIYLRS